MSLTIPLAWLSNSDGTMSFSAWALATITQMLGDVTMLLAVTLGPLVVFALIIHWLERKIQIRLAERFGWKSVLWTGWLGTPIHELSHAAMCLLFNHRIDKIVLFEPDLQSGRLGYVRHSFRKHNWFQEIGNVFIGVAPLIGGSIALIVVLWIFFADAANAAIEASRAANGSASVIESTLTIVTAICGEIFQAKHLMTWRFWGFIYLVLCVGGHMAPSSSDYEGASRGVFLLGFPVLALLILFSVAFPNNSAIISTIVEVLSPLFALLLVTVFLCALATAVVFLVTAFFPRMFRISTR